MSTVSTPRPNLFTDSLIMGARSARVVLRTPAAILPAIFMPLILMLVMTAGFARIVNPGGTYADYVNQVLPLFASMGMSFSALTTALAVHNDLTSGMDARLRTMPVARSAPMIGRIVGDAVRNLITLIVLGIVGVILGFRFSAGVPAAVLAVLLALFVGVTFAWLAVAIVVRAKSAEAATSLVNAILLILSFLSTGVVPAEDLPGWVQPFARNSPISAVVEAIRALTQGGPTAEPVLKALVWLVGLCAVFCAAAIVGLRKTHTR